MKKSSKQTSKKRTVSPAGLPAGYRTFLETLKKRIRSSQVKAAVAVNRELIAMYWHTGRDIVQKQKAEGWGKSIVERLSARPEKRVPRTEGIFPPEYVVYAGLLPGLG